METPLKIRWILSHVPYDLFLRSAMAFAEVIKQKTNGSIEVEVLGKNEWEEKYNNGIKVNYTELLDQMSAGEFEMSQVYSEMLARTHNDFYALGYPFLFRDHEHATRVLDGEIGEAMLNTLEEKSNIKGLAFTYSGGYKMIAANKKITKIADLKGLRVRCATNPVSIATFNAIGVKTQPLGIDGFVDAISNGEVDCGENVFPRYFRSEVDKVTNSIANTKHALFLTSIIVNSKFWNETLTAEQRIIFKECAMIAAAEERKASLLDGEQAQVKAVAENIDIVEWSDEAIDEFKTAVQSLDSKFENAFSIPNLIGKIRLS
jgi:TRAP-type C4-dicarboxylate transport system substrate-binding protein